MSRVSYHAVRRVVGEEQALDDGVAGIERDNGRLVSRVDRRVQPADPIEVIDHTPSTFTTTRFFRRPSNSA